MRYLDACRSRWFRGFATRIVQSDYRQIAPPLEGMVQLIDFSAFRSMHMSALA